MITITVVGILVALAALIWFGNRQMGVVLRAISENQPLGTPAAGPTAHEVERLHQALDSIEGKMADLYQAVADGIDHVDRNEKRVRGIVTGAKRKFAESDHYDAGVDAEYDTLPLEEDGGPLRLEPDLVEVPEEQQELDMNQFIPGAA